MRNSLRFGITALLLTLLVSQTKAQISLSPRAKLMAGVSDVIGDNSINELYKQDLSYGGGLELGIGLKNDFEIVAGLEYQRLSTQNVLSLSDEAGNGIGEARVRITFNQLNVPLLIKKTLNKNTGFYFTAGPSISFLINSQTITYFDSEGRSVTDAPDNTFNGTHLFVQGGIGSNLFELGRRQVSGELRYQRGVSNYFTTDDADFMSFQAVNVSVKIAL